MEPIGEILELFHPSIYNPKWAETTVDYIKFVALQPPQVSARGLMDKASDF